MCLKLQLPTKQKWMLVLLFAVGSLCVSQIYCSLAICHNLTNKKDSACIVSIVRLATLIPSLHSMNFTKFKVQVGKNTLHVSLSTMILMSYF
jgi:hypothetical protein